MGSGLCVGALLLSFGHCIGGTLEGGAFARWRARCGVGFGWCDGFGRVLRVVQALVMPRNWKLHLRIFSRTSQPTLMRPITKIKKTRPRMSQSSMGPKISLGLLTDTCPPDSLVLL